MGNTVFGRNLAKRRKALGLTQEQLAMRLNVSPQAVSKWENSSYPDGEEGDRKENQSLYFSAPQRLSGDTGCFFG